MQKLYTQWEGEKKKKDFFVLLKTMYADSVMNLKDNPPPLSALQSEHQNTLPFSRRKNSESNTVSRIFKLLIIQILYIYI